MEDLSIDGECPQENQGEATLPEPELDRTLARAIRRLIAEARDRDPLPEPVI